MPGEPVSGVAVLHFHHQAVAVDLGDDRSHRDTVHGPIAAGDAGLADLATRNSPGVDEQVLRRLGQRSDRARHRHEPGLVHVERVDLVMLDHADPDADGCCADRALEPLALFRTEEFRVAHAVEVDLRRQDDGRGHHRPGERPHPHLVDPGNTLEPGFPEGPLGEEHLHPLATVRARSLRQGHHGPSHS